MAIPAPRKGSVALVTGASSGIGTELARELARRGHDLVLVARRRERLEELGTELGSRFGVTAEPLVCDLADAADRETLPGQVGGQVDVLVLCAGFGMGGPFIEQSPERVMQMVRTNFESTIALAHAYVPEMAARRSGAILTVSSMAGFQPMPNFGAYAATKAGVTSFTEMLHWELRAHGVSVTALCPGGVRTEFDAVADMESQASRQPGLFMADPADVAGAGIAGLDAGVRVVVPTVSARVLARFGRIAPRRVWLPICKRLLTP